MQNFKLNFAILLALIVSQSYAFSNVVCSLTSPHELSHQVSQAENITVQMIWKGEGNVIISIDKVDYVSRPNTPIEISVPKDKPVILCIQMTKYNLCADYFLIVSSEDERLIVYEEYGSAKFELQKVVQKQERQHASATSLKNPIGFSLEGRELLPGYGTEIRDTKEEGTVVLNITVDQSGKVTEATPNLRESTTTSQYLISLCIDDVIKNFRFEEKQNSTEADRGQVRYVFKLE